MSDALNFFVSLFWLAIQIYCIYWCCVVKRVSKDQFNALVHRHDKISEKIGEIKQSKISLQIGVKQLQKDLKELKNNHKKTRKKLDDLCNSLNNNSVPTKHNSALWSKVARQRHDDQSNDD